MRQAVKLVGFTAPFIAELGGRNCYNSFKNSNVRSKNLGTFIYNNFYTCDNSYIGTYEYLAKLHKRGHDSVLEHLNFTFVIITSRAVLQQLARHRHISLSVRSTRYTLKQILKRPEKYLFKYNTPKHLYELNLEYVKNIADYILANNLRNDDVKHLLPENLLTHIVMTTNLRELLHIISLRADKHAWLPFREISLMLSIELKNIGFGELLPMKEPEKELDNVRKMLYNDINNIQKGGK